MQEIRLANDSGIATGPSLAKPKPRDGSVGPSQSATHVPNPASGLLFLTIAVFAGCSPWSTSPAGKSLLQAAKMSPDSVVVEFALLDLADVQQDLVSDLWREADEQHVSTELRQELTQNGLRCGVLGNQLPSWITDRLADRGRLLQLDQAERTAVVSDVLTQRRIQCRANQHRSVPVASKCKELELGGPNSEKLSKYVDAQCHLGIRAIPKGDGRVELELVPEIQHGPPRQRWVGGDGLFRLDASRDSIRYDALRVCATLVPGQTLILECLPGANGIGKAFVGNNLSDSPSPHGKLVLLRLAQTQLDDLFAPQQTTTPIATQAL
ncbi:MAG: hypothetical protein GX575_15515 [Candidatus Anammoximicrobium sp.]|nr:hypothetical protein [Candidatus Anammoximicrobium sp.]